jgi:hypothetical protein
LFWGEDWRNKENTALCSSPGEDIFYTLVANDGIRWIRTALFVSARRLEEETPKP